MSFGVPTSFGQFQASKPMFGQGTSTSAGQTLFGVSSSTFGIGTFGQVQTSRPMFSQSNSSTGIFGVTNTSSMNASPFAGSTSSSLVTGGSRRLPYAATRGEEEVNGTKKPIILQSISAMSIYKDKSHDELRFNDYEERAKGVQTPWGKPSESSSVPVNNPFTHPQCSNPSPFTPFSTPSTNNPFSTSTNPFALPATTTTPNPFTSPSPLSPQKSPFLIPSKNPSLLASPFAPQSQTTTTTTTPTPFTSPSPFSPQKNLFTTPMNPSPFTNPFSPQSQAPTTTTTPTPFTSPSPFSPQKNPFTTPSMNPYPFTFPVAPQSQTTTTTTPNPFSSPSPFSPQKNPFTTPSMNPSPFTFPVSPQSDTTTTTTTPTPFSSPSPFSPRKNPFTTPSMNPSPFTNPFAPQSQAPTTTTTPTPFTSPSPFSPRKNPFTTPMNPSPFTFPVAPQSQTTTTTTTPTPFSSPSPFSPQKNPVTTSMNPSPFTFPVSPRSETTTTTTTPTPFSSPSPFSPRKNPFTTPSMNPSPFTNPFAPQSQAPTTTTTPTPFTSPSPFSPQKNPFTTPSMNPSPFIFHSNTTEVLGIPPTSPSPQTNPFVPITTTTNTTQGPSNLMEPTVVGDPFGLRSEVNTSIIQPEAVTSTRRGISNLPIKNNSAPVRISSSYRIRHLSTRRISLPANRYNLESSGSKVPFFSDKEYRPCLVDTFLARENPRAWVVNNPYQQEHAPIATCKNGEACEDKAGTNSCLQENENSIKVNTDTSLHGKLRLADDPLVSSLMPKLPCGGEYYTEPSVEELEAKERAEPGFCTHVKNFVVGRKDKGSIKFLGETDIRCLDLESIVKFNDREVIVYEDDGKKPPVGQGLNRPAEITLLNVKLLGKTSGKQFSNGHKLEKMLMKKTNEQGAEFVSYNPVRGEWKFRVQHFEN